MGYNENDSDWIDEDDVTYEAPTQTDHGDENGGNQDGRQGLSLKAKGIITAALVILYLVVPFDVVPDAMVGLGQIDDAIVFATGVLGLLMTLRPRR